MCSTNPLVSVKTDFEFSVPCALVPFPFPSLPGLSTEASYFPFYPTVIGTLARLVIPLLSLSILRGGQCASARLGLLSALSLVDTVGPCELRRTLRSKASGDWLTEPGRRFIRL